MSDKNAITSFQGQYRWLSNFWECDIFYKGLTFKTLEHAYQWEKCVDLADKFLVWRAASPGIAKDFANADFVVRRPDWDTIKVEVMKELLRIKFSDENLGAKLLATGNKYLIEGNTWKDTFWGVYRGQGFNRLGLLLMEVREELRKAF